MSRSLVLAPLTLAFALALAACDEAGNQQSGSATQDPVQEQQSEMTTEPSTSDGTQ